MAGLRLDVRDASAFEDQDGVIAIIPGDIEGSELIYRLITEDTDIADQLIVRYWSVIGSADGIEFRKCLEENAKLAYGAFALKDDQLVLMDTQLVADADPMEVGASIGNLAAYADRYERDLFGVDHY